MLASDVMDRAAALMNDPSRGTYSYSVQLPYLKIALDELEEELSVRGVQVTKEVSTVSTLNPGTVTLAPPADLVDPIDLQEKFPSETRWLDMIELSWEPDDLEPIDRRQFWTFRENEFKFPDSTTACEVRIRYTKKLAQITGESSTIPFINSLSFLAYRTASLCAHFIAKNATISEELKAMAYSRVGTLLTSSIRGSQASRIRRKPYRLGRISGSHSRG